MAEFNSLPERVGRYEINRLLGQGAMGRVFLARDPILDREVAIKMLRADLDIGPEMRESLLTRMRHEARAAARVCHPNIVTLHDMIDDEQLGVCLVFELVRGQTLKVRIADSPLSPSEVAQIARQVGSALTLAHQAGVLHRDVKPENIMMAAYGAKVTDFGIARVPDSTLTRTGGLLGTPAYSAPECISGSHFSAASDQFSFAATLYEALSGLRAFPGDDAVTVAARIGTEDPTPIASALRLSSQVDEVFMRGLSKTASQRFASCQAFGEALGQAIEAELLGTRAQPQAHTDHDPSVPSPSRPLALWTSVALGGAAVGALCALFLVSLARPASPTALDLITTRQSVDSAATVVPQPDSPVARSSRGRPRGEAKTAAGDDNIYDASTTKDQDALGGSTPAAPDARAPNSLGTEAADGPGDASSSSPPTHRDPQ